MGIKYNGSEKMNDGNSLQICLVCNYCCFGVLHIRYEAKVLQQTCLQPSDTNPCCWLDQGRATQACPL